MSIKSSIIFVATFLSYGLMSTGFPCSSRIILFPGNQNQSSHASFVSSVILRRAPSSAQTSAQVLYTLRSPPRHVLLRFFYAGIAHAPVHFYDGFCNGVVDHISFSSIFMIQLNARRFSPAFSEQIPFDSLCGSIGITRSTRYTDVPLLSASTSSALLSCT